MKIIVACDSFKDALDASGVCRAIERGLIAAQPGMEIVRLPLADGGEGTGKILGSLTGSDACRAVVSDPLFRPVSAAYFVSPVSKVAFLDMAEASGLGRLSPKERNPAETTSFGTGEMILDALTKAVDKIVIGIGGSATNDAGMGMARALGYRFLDRRGNELTGTGRDLVKIDRIVVPGKTPWKRVEIEVLCDVVNPLFGPSGAACIYASQKGADKQMVEDLDRGLRRFAVVCQQTFDSDYAVRSGAGAAGGLGFGLQTFLGARLIPGIDAVLEYAQLARHLKGADLVITGEGKLDAQTASGKLISGVCRLARACSVPVIALCGRLEADDAAVTAMGLQAAYSINPPEIDLTEALRRTAHYLEHKTIEVFRKWAAARI